MMFSCHKRLNATSVQIWASEDKHEHTSALRNSGINFFAVYYGCLLCRRISSFISRSWISSMLGQFINSFKTKYHWFRGKVGGVLWVSLELLAIWQWTCSGSCEQARRTQSVSVSTGRFGGKCLCFQAVVWCQVQLQTLSSLLCYY